MNRPSVDILIPIYTNTLPFCSSDVDKKQCCKTPPLKSALSNEWKANSKATLGEAFFGPCNGTKFLVSRVALFWNAALQQVLLLEHQLKTWYFYLS
jgi:hypothetical protein